MPDHIQRFVPEEFLEGEDISSVADELDGSGSPEPVGMHFGHIRDFTHLLEDMGQVSIRDFEPFLAQKNKIVSLGGFRSGHADIAEQ